MRYLYVVDPASQRHLLKSVGWALSIIKDIADAKTIVIFS
jgi:hypothetical protein